MHAAFATVIFLLAQQGGVSAATAREPRGHLTAVPLLAVQPAGEPFNRVSPPLSGHALGVLISAGWWMNAQIGVEGELTFGRSVSAPQRFSYNWLEDYTAQSRDLMGTFLVRWRPAGNRTVHLVAGAGAARSTIGQRDITTTYILRPGQPVQHSPGWNSTTTGLAFTAGLDVNLPVNRQVAIVPAFRVRSIDRSNLEFATYMGIDRVRYDVGVGVRAGF